MLQRRFLTPGPPRRYGLAWRGPEVAEPAEDAGITAFCCSEFVDREAYTTLAEMVQHTKRAQVGPGIAYAFARTPYAHPAAVRAAWRHAPGRVFLGLGSGAHRINRDWFGVPADRPAARMADLVGAIRAWLHAENGQRIFNPGSPTDRRRQPHGTVGLLDIAEGRLVSAQILPVT